VIHLNFGNHHMQFANYGSILLRYDAENASIMRVHDLAL